MRISIDASWKTGFAIAALTEAHALYRSRTGALGRVTRGMKDVGPSTEGSGEVTNDGTSTGRNTTQEIVNMCMNGNHIQSIVGNVCCMNRADPMFERRSSRF
jgi:hypothetical protein